MGEKGLLFGFGLIDYSLWDIFGAVLVRDGWENVCYLWLLELDVDVGLYQFCFPLVAFMTLICILVTELTEIKKIIT